MAPNLPDEERPFLAYSPRTSEDGYRKPRHVRRAIRSRWQIMIIVLGSLLLLFAVRRPVERAYQMGKCSAAISLAGMPIEPDTTDPHNSGINGLPEEEWARLVHPVELMKMAYRGDLQGSRIIHQSWKNRDNLPESFDIWSREWRKLHDSSWIYVLWTDEDNKKLVETYYPEYLETYNNLPKEIYRADMIRNMYMHRFGGVYADLDLIPLISLSERLSISNTTEHVSPRTAYVGRMSSAAIEHSIPNAFLASTAPFHPFWLKPLEFIRERSGIWKFYRRPEELTGPVALKACVDQWTQDVKGNRDLGELDKLEVIEDAKIYPFSWNDSPLSSKCICDPRNPTFDAGRCHRLYPSAWTMTYWTHSWGSQ